MTQIQLPHYEPQQVAGMLQAVPFGPLMHEARGLAFLEQVADTATELQAVLGQYPRVRYVPLDFHYCVIQGLGALNPMLLNDLVWLYGWRGRVWAALLSALSLDDRFLPLMREALEISGPERWVVQLAVNALSSKGKADCPAGIERLRAALSTVPRPVVRLQEVGTLEAQTELQQAVRAAYRTGGADAALAVLRAR